MKTCVLIACGAALALAAGCASTQTAATVQRWGFLSPDYSKLTETSGADHEPLLLYRSPDAPLGNYDKLMIDPVTIWLDDSTSSANAADRQRLADNAYKIIWSRLSAHAEIVDQPGPGVLRLSLAIVEGDASSVNLDTVSSVVPQMRALTTLTGYATGGPGFGGGPAAEWKLVDTETGELVVAGADPRVGNAQDSSSTLSWSDLHGALAYWADRSAYNICRWRGVRSDCTAPAAKSGS